MIHLFIQYRWFDPSFILRRPVHTLTSGWFLLSFVVIIFSLITGCSSPKDSTNTSHKTDISMTGMTTITMEHETASRHYSIYVPSSYDAKIETPLVFNFHGGGSTISSHMAISDMRSLAETGRFILVYPQAKADPNDNDSFNWIHKPPTSVDDITFISAIIDDLSNDFTIDRDRVYACGYSLGGEFTFDLACRLNDKIAAIAVVSRTMSVSTHSRCDPSHPTAVLTILGTDDTTSPYDGLSWNNTLYYLSADDALSYWTTYNQLQSEPNITSIPDRNTADNSTVIHYRWAHDTRPVSVEHYKVLGGGHDWPGSFGNMDIDSNTIIWNFLSQFAITP